MHYILRLHDGVRGGYDAKALDTFFTSYHQLQQTRRRLRVDVSSLTKGAGAIVKVAADLLSAGFLYGKILVLLPIMFIVLTVLRLALNSKYLKTDIQSSSDYVTCKQEQERLRSLLIKLDNLKMVVDSKPFFTRITGKCMYLMFYPSVADRMRRVTGKLEALNLKNYKGRMRVVTEDESWKNRSKAYDYVI